jgi:hypothetical protein
LEEKPHRYAETPNPASLPPARNQPNRANDFTFSPQSTRQASHASNSPNEKGPPLGDPLSNNL